MARAFRRWHSECFQRRSMRHGWRSSPLLPFIVLAIAQGCGSNEESSAGNNGATAGSGGSSDAGASGGSGAVGGSGGAFDGSAGAGASSGSGASGGSGGRGGSGGVAATGGTAGADAGDGSGGTRASGGTAGVGGQDAGATCPSREPQPSDACPLSVGLAQCDAAGCVSGGCVYERPVVGRPGQTCRVTYICGCAPDHMFGGYSCFFTGPVRCSDAGTCC
jgi:hypothetical protein